MSFKQQINLKFLVWPEKTRTETFKLLQEVYRDATMSRTRIFEWHKRFKEGRKNVEYAFSRLLTLEMEGQQQAERTKMLSM